VKLPFRNHFKRNGRPKRAYSQDEARREALRSRKNAYRCSLCGHWHVGGAA
jgi:hypothetical protein